MNSNAQISSDKSLSGQVLFFIIIQIIVKVRGIITLPILSRLIGVDGYGVIGALLAFSGIFQMIIVFGTNSALTVYIPWIKEKIKRSQEFWMITQLVAGTALVSLVLLVIFHEKILLWFFPAGFRAIYFLLGVLVIPLQAINLMFYAQIVNNHQAKAYANYMGIATLIEFLLVIAFTYYFGVSGLLTATIAGQIILMFFLLHIVISEDSFVPLRSSMIKEVKKYYGYGFLMFITGSAGWIIEASDRIIIGKAISLAEVGIYQVSYSICSRIGTLAVPIFSPLLPFVASAIADDNRELAKKYLEKTYRLLIILFVPIVIFISLEGKDLLVILSTSAFYRGYYIIPFVACGIALSQLLGVFTYSLHAFKKGRFIVLAVFVAAVLNLTLNILFIPRFGIIAAALTTLLAYMVYFTIVRYFASNYLRVRMESIFLYKIIASAIIIIGVIMLIRVLLSALILRFSLTLLVSFSIYFVIIIATKAITEDEQKRIWKLFSELLSPKRGNKES